MPVGSCSQKAVRFAYAAAANCVDWQWHVTLLTTLSSDGCQYAALYC